MITTRRRINIAQAYKLHGQEWASIIALMGSGCYGTVPAIQSALRLMRKYSAVDQKTLEGGVIVYRVTPYGMALLGMVPEKI